MRLLLTLLAIGSILAIAGCGNDSSSTTSAASPKTVTVTVVGAQPQGGIERVTVKRGDKVTLVVHSDVADEIHLHGYNLMQDVEADGTVRITFVASVPGRFEAELEQRGVQILDLTVDP